MLLIHRHHHNILAKAVNHNARQMIFHQHFHILLFSTVHPETLLRIICHVQLLKVISALPTLIYHPKIQHLIHPVMLDHLRI